MPRSADCSAAISAVASLRPTSAIPTPAHLIIPTLPRWRVRPASRASTSTARPILPTRCVPRLRHAGPISSMPISAPTRIRAARACGSSPAWARANQPSADATNPDGGCEASSEREGTGVRRIIAEWVAAIFAALVASSAPAQTSFPARTVKFIVPFPGGGINDVLARNIGADLAYQSEPDGYTLLLSPPGPLAINQTLYKHLSYKPQEFVPITVFGSVPNVVI